jgi:hypothetical protein
VGPLHIWGLLTGKNSFQGWEEPGPQPRRRLKVRVLQTSILMLAAEVTMDNLEEHLSLIKRENEVLVTRAAMQQQDAASDAQRQKEKHQESSEAMQRQEYARREKAAIVIQTALYWRPMERRELQLQHEERTAANALQAWVRLRMPHVKRKNALMRADAQAKEQAEKEKRREAKEAQIKHLHSTCPPLPTLHSEPYPFVMSLTDVMLTRP